MSYLPWTEVLAEKESPVNGRIKVVKSLGFGTYIQVNGLTQSGGVVYEVWRTVLKKLSHQSLTISHCLILGLGGGSAAKLIKKYWPQAEITGVDIDSTMVELGKKYLGLPDIKTVIDDAENFLLTISHPARRSYASSVAGGQPSAIKYDLILVDTYLGDNFPKKFERDDFLIRIKHLLSPNGLAVFNRLYYGDKRGEAMRFASKLEKAFSKVKYVFPEANVMFVCYNK